MKSLLGSLFIFVLLFNEIQISSAMRNSGHSKKRPPTIGDEGEEEVPTPKPTRSPRINLILSQNREEEEAREAQRAISLLQPDPYAGLSLAQRHELMDKHHSQYKELYESKIAASTLGGMYQAESVHPYFQARIGSQASHQGYGHDQHTSHQDPPQTRDFLATMFRSNPSSSNAEEIYGGHNQNEEGQNERSCSGSNFVSGSGSRSGSG